MVVDPVEQTIGFSGNIANENWVGMTYDASIYAGWSGWSGQSGLLGQAGLTGWPGLSGWSGQSGQSGLSGWSGWSGLSGHSAWSGWSGWSGYPIFDWNQSLLLGWEADDLALWPEADPVIYPMSVRLGSPMYWKVLQTATKYGRMMTNAGAGWFDIDMDCEIFIRAYRTLNNRGAITTSGNSCFMEFSEGRMLYCSYYSVGPELYSITGAALAPAWDARGVRWNSDYDPTHTEWLWNVWDAY